MQDLRFSQWGCCKIQSSWAVDCKDGDITIFQLYGTTFPETRCHIPYNLNLQHPKRWSSSYHVFPLNDVRSLIIHLQLALAVIRFRYLGQPFLETIRIRRHLRQQVTTLCSKCGAAVCLGTQLHERMQTAGVREPLHSLL
jgi:hypothetical protein